ncbi:hypothetical protein [Actinoplanes sp. NPDC049681]|uniref:hypothetical protein n=1 Tax=Actinoplanes sp. NPDC049681 TaxID=3363905 RepID=UPI003798982B
MTGGPADAVVTLRDADEPRPLAGRLVGTAHRYPDGWSFFIPHADVRTRHETVDDAVAAFARSAGVRHVLMLWTEL